MKIEDYLEKKRKMADRALLKYLPKPLGKPKELLEAMRYSVLAGGKRIRPILMLAIADMFNKPYTNVMPAACAVEYIHTSTLILDDLPCMDNSDLRRGRQSVHKKFGQSTAVLASYSLVVLAFEMLAKDAKAAKCISAAVGFNGVCAGQYVDLKSGAEKIDISTLAYLHRHKTADLFSASCEIAGMLSGASAARLKALSGYGMYLGLAFQIYDDILSVKKTDAQLGKQTKKDINSPNTVNLFGMQTAQNALNKNIDKAGACIRIFGARADILRQILKYTIERDR